MSTDLANQLTGRRTNRPIWPYDATENAQFITENVKKGWLIDVYMVGKMIFASFDAFLTTNAKYGRVDNKKAALKRCHSL